MTTTSRLAGLYKLDPATRFARVVDAAGGDAERIADLHADDPQLMALADRMIENALGVMPVPLGVAANFRIDGRDRLVPMATEESSVVAAASHAAAIARDLGGFTTSATEPLMIAQVQVLDVPDLNGARLRLLEARDELLGLADEQDPVLVRHGGGARDVRVRIVGSSVVVHLVVNVGDAMGANAVNTMAEALAPRIASIADGRPLLRILSNKADLRLVRARGAFSVERLGGPDIVQAIVDGYRLAAEDPYRAATHNKGIMNGISAVVLATGNDTRAVEAGAHSHAVREGRYTSLSDFEIDAGGNLVATLELPMPVGLVGGATTVHPVARAAIRLLEVETARELAGIVVAVGLAQNVAAVKALATEGIQRGHMSLHARNMVAAIGARPEEVDAVAARLISEGRVRQDRAEALLAELREESSARTA